MGNELPIAGILGAAMSVVPDAGLQAHRFERAGKQLGRFDQVPGRSTVGLGALAQAAAVRGQLFGKHDQGSQGCAHIGVPQHLVDQLELIGGIRRLRYLVGERADASQRGVPLQAQARLVELLVHLDRLGRGKIRCGLAAPPPTC